MENDIFFGKVFFFVAKNGKKPEIHPALNTTQKVKFSIEDFLNRKLHFLCRET